MDDEAQIRITLIVAVAAVLFACALVFGLGVARNSVPQAQAAAQVDIVKVEVQQCNNLPREQRLTCVQGVVKGPEVLAALENCSALTTDLAESQCSADILSAQKPTASELGVVECDHQDPGNDVNNCLKAVAQIRRN